MNRLKILLLNPPAKSMVIRDYCCGESAKADYYWPPIDLLVLSGIISKKHDVEVLDAIIYRLSYKDTHKKILKIKPDAIIFLTSAVTFLSDLEFAKGIKNDLKCQIFTIGDIAYFEPQRLMERYSFIDGIIMDFTSDGILKLIDGENNPKGVVYRVRDKIVVGAQCDTKVFHYPMPKHKLFPLNKYKLPHSRHSSITTVLSAYGCPYHCTFCSSGKLLFKFRDIDNFIDELKYISNMGIKEVYFRDFTFTADKKRVAVICEKILESEIRIDWSCLTRVDRVDRELLSLMKAAGCYLIYFGVESGDDKILDDSKKRVSTKLIREVFKWCRELGILTLAHFIIGLPEDNEESINKTIDFAKEIKCDYASFNLYVPRLGSILRAELIDHGRIADDNFSKLDCSVEVAEVCSVPMEKLLQLHKKALRSFYIRPYYIFKCILNLRTKDQFFNLIKNGIKVTKTAL